MNEEDLNKMFNIVGITKAQLHSALREMGPLQLKEKYRSQWSPEKPTSGYCYIVSEVIYHHFAPEGTKSYRLELIHDSHWFLKYPNGEIIDLTADQNLEDYKYDSAIEKPFITKKISRRGKLLAKKLKLNL